MPIVIQGNVSSQSYTTSETFDYKYPNSLDLKPGSTQHSRLLSFIMDKAQESRRIMDARYNDFQVLDDLLRAYIPVEVLDPGYKKRKTKKTVIVPAMFAALETMLSQMVVAFLDSPIMRYKGGGPEDIIGAIMLEKVIDRQAGRSKIGLNLHTLFRDALVYGFGVVTSAWEVRRGLKISVEEQDKFFSPVFELLGIPIEKVRKKKKERGIVWEGNALYSIDPYMYLPDTSVPIDRPQEGSFVGWLARDNLMDLLSEEKAGDSGLFNVRYLKEGVPRTSTLFKDYRASKSGVDLDANEATHANPVDLMPFFIKLIPSSLGLGDSDYPEMWQFLVAGDSLIIQAERAEYPYDSDLPVAVCAPEYDGHSAVPISRLEIGYGMQSIIDFLFSSHMENVKRSINNNLLVDPSMVVMKDLKRPVPGGLIRLRRRAWGMDVNRAVKQLAMTDITRGHLADAVFAMEIMNRGFGSNESMQGVQRKGSERVTAEEVRGVKMGALVRIDRSVRVASLQCMNDLAVTFAKNTQENMTEEMWVDLTGRWEKELKREYPDKERVLVNPMDIIVDHDIVAQDIGGLTQDDPNLWFQLTQMALTNPELVQRLDGVRIWMHWARIAGARNLQAFERNSEEAPTFQVEGQEGISKGVGEGNLIPIGAV